MKRCNLLTPIAPVEDPREWTDVVVFYQGLGLILLWVIIVSLY